MKIPHLTSAAHRFISDRLLSSKEPIFTSYPFLGLPRKRGASPMRAVVNIPMQTLIKMIILQLEPEPPVVRRKHNIA